MFSLSYFEKRAKSGSTSDIDFIMNQLNDEDDMCTAKIADYSLGLVTTQKGINRIKFYLFNGSTIQRNYAAVFFKRIGNKELLDAAVSAGLIESELAYSK